jgi:tripartite-type tricarboxylate transporter receptor subunit TctC
MGQMVDAGQLVPLAVAQPHRSPLMPNVRTLAECGVKGADFDAWFMVFAPAGTPAEIVARLNREGNAVLQVPDVRKKLSVIGVEPVGGSVEGAAKTVQHDYESYRRIVADFGIKAE